MRKLITSAFALSLVGCLEQPPQIRSSGQVPFEPDPSSTENADEGTHFVDTFTAGYSQKIDFLFVVDNSGSMGEEIATVRTSLQSFVSGLMKRRTVDYQMAVVNTDAEHDEGRLIRSQNGINVVKGVSTQMNPIVEMTSIFAKIEDQVRSGARVWETGLMASEFAITNHGRAFLRQDVPLAIIYLSDEDDQSCRLDPFKCSPEHYARYFKGLNKPVLLYPIVGLDSNQCPEVYQSGVFQGGYRYQRVQELMGTGASYSICRDDLSESFLAIAKQISDRGMCYALKHAATEAPSEVRVDGEAWSRDEHWRYEAGANSVCFPGDDVPEAGSHIEISYLGR